jgi:hypothetical protein
MAAPDIKLGIGGLIRAAVAQKLRNDETVA